MPAALPSARAQPLFAAEPADQWRREPLADIMLVYHVRSGQTHMMVSPASEILAAVSALGRASASDVAASLSADFDLGDLQEAELAIARHLHDLAELGLVHRA